MFQPAEELLAGSKDMINAGVLEGVSAAFALHVQTGMTESKNGMLLCPEGPGTNSGDAFTIRIKGKGAHGSMIQDGVDAILIAANMIQAFQALVTREVEMDEPCVLLVGTIKGGTSINTVAEEAELGISLRTANAKVREHMQKRISEIAEATAKVYGGQATVEHPFGVPPLENDLKLRQFAKAVLTDVFGREQITVLPKLGGEDFA